VGIKTPEFEPISPTVSGRNVVQHHCKEHAISRRVAAAGSVMSSLLNGALFCMGLTGRYQFKQLKLAFCL
jgi:hypothetical protein